MKNAPDLSIRKSRPQSLGGVFGGLIKIFGGRASDADLSARWGKIVGKDLAEMGDMAGISKARKSKDGPAPRTITIRAKNPAFALQLSYHREEIRDRVNKYFGSETIGKVIIRKT